MKISGICLIFFLSLWPGNLWADGHGHGGASLEERYFGEVYFILQHKRELGLTDEQIQAIKDRKFDVKRQGIQSEAQMQLIMLDLERELHKEAPAMEPLSALIDDKIEVKRTLSKAYLQAIVDLKLLLTPEQRKQTKEIFWSERFGHAHRPHAGKKSRKA